MVQNFAVKAWIYNYGKNLSDEEVRKAVGAAFNDTLFDCDIDWHGKDAVITMEGEKDVQYLPDEYAFYELADSGTLCDRVIRVGKILNAEDDIEVDTDTVSIFSDSEDKLLERIQEEREADEAFGLSGVLEETYLNEAI